MSNTKTSIQWCDATWNCVRGCSRVSPGCQHCFAERMAIRQQHGAYQGLVKLDANGKPAWSGEVRLVNERLTDPLGWRKPRRIFVNSMSDLFHEKLPEKDIALVFSVMAQARRHRFQVLTKRAERMEELTRSASFIASVAGFAGDMTMEWPLPNVWLGVSVESQRYANERIPHLLRAPAAVRFLSCEPLLEAVDLRPWLGDPYDPPWRGLAWAIVGGESGPGARPFHLEWAADLLEQCRWTSGTAYFLKQVGARPVAGGVRLHLRDSHGADMDEWPAELRIREFPPAEGET